MTDKYEALREAIKGATQGLWVKSKIWQGWSKPYREDALTSSAQLIADENGDVVAMAVTCFEGWGDAAKSKELDANASYIAAANPVAIADLLAERDALSEALKSAAARIEDMLMDDDGQAWKEARKALPVIHEALKKAEA